MNRQERRRNRWLAALPKRPQAMRSADPAAVTAACLTVLAVLAAAAALFFARAYLLPIAAALVFSVILAPLCGRLEWLRLPRPVAAGLSLAVASAIAWAGVSAIAAPAARWLEDAPQTLNQARERIEQLGEPLRAVREISNEVDSITIVPADTNAPEAVVVQGPELTQSLMASLQIIAVQTVFVFVLTYFFLITREEIRLKIIAFQPSLPGRVRMARMFRDAQKRVSSYILTFSLINVVFGAAVGLAMWRLGLPEPVMWGGIAALLNFVPYLGPAVTMLLLGLAGLATFDTLLAAALPIVAYSVINFIETNMLTPLVMGRRMTLNPLAIVMAVSFWTWIWGPVGGLISLPLLIMFKVACDHTRGLAAVGALIGAPLARPNLVRARADPQTGSAGSDEARPATPAEVAPGPVVAAPGGASVVAAA
jgi:predicted PurR-regulated permease PerM